MSTGTQINTAHAPLLRSTSSYTHRAQEKRKALKHYSVSSPTAAVSNNWDFVQKLHPLCRTVDLEKSFTHFPCLLTMWSNTSPSPSLQHFPLAWSSWKSSATVQIISPILEGAALNSKSHQAAQVWSFLLASAHSPLIPAFSITLVPPCPLILFSISA